jgi:hypothetical protein
MSLAFCILCQSVPMWFRLCTHSPQSCFHDFPSSTGIQILDQGALCLLHRYAQVIRVQCLVFCKTRWQTCSHSGMQLRIVGISPRISIQTVWMVHHGEDVEHTTHPLPMYGGRRLGYAGMAMFYIVFLMLFDVICLIRSWIVYIRSLIIWWAIWFLHDICPKHRFLGHENEKFLPGSAAGDVNFVVRGRAFL